MEPDQPSRFPTLELLDPATPHTFIQPAKRINEGQDVTAFLSSKAYRDIGTFILQLNRAMCPRKVKGEDGKETTLAFHIGSQYETAPAQSVRCLQKMLAKIDSFIDEAPPDTGPRRFGNVSFRKWYALTEQRASALLQEALPESVLKFGPTDKASGHGAEDELTAYLLASFGSQQRLDYGTGHELSFLAFLGCLWKLGAFKDGRANGDIERNIVLGLLEPYLGLVRRLILTYKLEPAGSHGVWGLDDHSFQPYIYGSAQLSRAITDDEPMPLEGSLFRAPKPALVLKTDIVNEERKRNMYFSAIGFINDVKTGPFWEHSPILFDISGIKDGWGKINKGMIKMFNAEVLSKFPVIQHFAFGSLFSWDQDPEAARPQQDVHTLSQPMAAGSAQAHTTGAGTVAPWAQATSMPPARGGNADARAPGAGAHLSMRPQQASGSNRPQPPSTQAPGAEEGARSSA